MKGFIVIGDTHRNHKLIIHRIKTLQIEDTTLLHVGDFGVGYLKYSREIEELETLNDFLASKNCHLYVIRGNHDNPIFFEGNHDYSNLHLMPDYSVIEVNGEKVLMVGGAVSVNRVELRDIMLHNLNYNKFDEYWWKDEAFVLDMDKLKDLRDIRYVVTHSCPNFTFPFNDQSNIPLSHGSFVESYVHRFGDTSLKNDLNKERNNITEMYNILNENNYIDKWFYGHYHTSERQLVDSTNFILLDCDEFYNVTQIETNENDEESSTSDDSSDE